MNGIIYMTLDPHEPSKYPKFSTETQVSYKNHLRLKHIHSPERGRNLSEAFKRLWAISR